MESLIIGGTIVNFILLGTVIGLIVAIFLRKDPHK